MTDDDVAAVIQKYGPMQLDRLARWVRAPLWKVGPAVARLRDRGLVKRIERSRYGGAHSMFQWEE